MKLKEWIDFNKGIYNGDLVVKVLKQRSYKTDDILFHTVASLDTCSKLFGEYELDKIGLQNMPNSDVTRFGCLLWVNKEL